MKKRLALFYISVSLIILTAIAVGVICFLPTDGLSRTVISDFSVVSEGLDIEDMCILGNDEGSSLQFERYHDLSADAVFDLSLVTLYPVTGHLSTRDTDGESLSDYIGDGGLYAKYAYAQFEQNRENIFLTVTVIDDKNGGCLKIIGQTKADSADNELFTEIISSVRFEN